MIELNYSQLGWKRFFVPRRLTGFIIPATALHPWEIYLLDGRKVETHLLPSTRVTTKIIILHFRAINSRMRRDQIILPAMLGSQNFHDLLVFLKIN